MLTYPALGTTFREERFVKDDAVEYVRGLELPTNESLDELIRNIEAAPDGASKDAIRASDADNTPSAQVIGGSLSSFTERLTGLSKGDVKNSTLFAQLASDAAFDRYSRPMDWYRNYVDVLGRIGWNQPAFSFDTYTSGGTTVQLDEAVLGILAAIATGNELAMIRATMEGLKSLSDDSKQMTIWNSRASRGNSGNFQILPVDKLDNDDVVMVLTGMQFTARTSHSRFLWWSWSSSSIDIRRAANRFVLNEDVYSRVREAIIDRLGDAAERFVADVPLAL